MLCPLCLSKTKITNSRRQKKTFSTWRRHSCIKCPNVFTTIETIDLSTSHYVIFKDSSIEKFSWLKLYISLYKALDHRPSAPDDASNITNSIVGILINNRKLYIEAEDIFKIVIKTLSFFDPAAAIKYQSTRTPIMNKRDVQNALKR